MNTTRDIQNRATNGEPVYTPNARILEDSGKLVLLVDLPGVGEPELELSLDANVLTLRARMNLAAPADQEPAWSEFRPGRFEREFRLGEELDPASIQAVLKNGVLRIELARRETTRRIPVSAG